jgi:hypothetical protein
MKKDENGMVDLKSMAMADGMMHEESTSKEDMSQ